MIKIIPDFRDDNIIRNLPWWKFEPGGEIDSADVLST